MKVTALIPCFNEEKRIGRVLETVIKSPIVNPTIVVDDGSTDGSEEVIKRYSQVQLVSLPSNVGKGGAVRKGLKRVKTPIVFLCDADLSGLKEKHIKKIVEPVRTGKVEICVGVRYKGGPIVQWLRRNFLPLIAGERAIKTTLLKKILVSPLTEDFGIEPYMNFYCSRKGIKIKKVDLRGVNDILKIRKRGVRYFLEKFALFFKIYLILLLLRIKALVKISDEKILD